MPPPRSATVPVLASTLTMLATGLGVSAFAVWYIDNQWLTSLEQPIRQFREWESFYFRCNQPGMTVFQVPAAPEHPLTLSVVHQHEAIVALVVPALLSETQQSLLQQATAVAAQVLLHHTALEHQRQTLDQTRELLELSSDYIYCSRFVGETLMFEWITSAFQRITGYTPEELGKYGLWVKLFHPDDVSLLERHHRRVRAGQQSIAEFRIYTRQGRLRWIREYSRPYRSADSAAVTHILGAAKDITSERDTAEVQQHDASTLQFQSHMLNTVEQGIIATDGRGQVRYWNQHAERLYGWSYAEAYGRPLAALTGISIAAIPRAETGMVQTWAQELTARHRDDHPVHVAATFTPFGGSEDQPGGMLCITTDIGALRAVREALAESERRYRFITEHMLDMVALFDETLHFQYASPSVLEITGYTIEEMRNRSVIEFIHQDDVPELNKLTRSITRKHLDEVHTTFRYRHVSGEWRWCEASARMTRWNDTPAIVANGRDITEQRALELHVAHTQRMESIAVLAGGVAHDFNNMLSVIIGYADLLASDVPADTQMLADLDAIREAARRGATLTAQLLTFARRQILAPLPVHINDIVQNMHLLIQQLLGPSHRLHVLLGDTVPVMTADIAQIEQVIINLVTNARDAMRAPGHLLIHTSVASQAEEAQVPADMPDNEYVMLSVIDTGEGIPAAIQSRIFEPFFTTREQGHGNGLGLATCYGIVEQHGGSIRVSSAEGHGTRVDVFLPCSNPGPRLSPGSVARNHPAPVLVVAPDSADRALYSTILELAGYSVLTAGSAAGAHTQLASTPLLVALVVALPPGDEYTMLLEHHQHQYPRLPLIVLAQGTTPDAPLPVLPSAHVLPALPDPRMLIEAIRNAPTHSSETER